MPSHDSESRLRVTVPSHGSESRAEGTRLVPRPGGARAGCAGQIRVDPTRRIVMR